MRKYSALLRSLIALVVTMGFFLAAMVGVFWLLDILPILALVGMVVYYAVVSTREPRTKGR
jgi:hypothetical protein